MLPHEVKNIISIFPQRHCSCNKYKKTNELHKVLNWDGSYYIEICFTILSTGQTHTGGSDQSHCVLTTWYLSHHLPKGRNKVTSNRIRRIHCHHLAAGVALVTLGSHFVFHSLPKSTDLHPVLQAKLNIMGNTKIQIKKKRKTKTHQDTSQWLQELNLEITLSTQLYIFLL